MPRVQLSLFGDFSLRIDGRPCHIRNKKARELLAYLAAANGDPVKKTVLSEALWPDVPPSNARESLYKVLRHCRTTEPMKTHLPLGAGHNQVWLDTGRLECDIFRFEQALRRPDDIPGLVRAVELYKGPFLFNEYYEWTAEKEAFYEIRFWEMAETLAAYYDRQNQPARAYYYRKKLSTGT